MILLLNREKLAQKIVKLSGFLLLIVAVLLLAWSFISRNEVLQDWYAEYQAILYEFQQRVIYLEDKWIIIIIIESLFLLKSIIPFPMSFMFIVSGMVFPVYYALLIDISGLCILLSVRYAFGYRLGGGRTHRFLKRNPALQRFFERDGKGNPLLLFFLRLVPSVPVNTISQLYGAMKFEYPQYIAISLLGFSPKLISYNFVGNNVYNPFSAKFITPLIILCIISGVSMLAVNRVLEYIANKDKKKS